MDQEIRKGIARRTIQILFMVLVQAAMLFISSGSLRWKWAWVFIGLNLAGIMVNAFFMFRYNPDAIAERSKSEGMKKWDKVVGGSWALIYFIVLLLVAGLDTRLSWSGPMTPALHLAGCAAFLTGGAVFSWAMVSNAYFSTVVRIQDERGHQVCDSGPYRFVRHPGYIGAIIQGLGVPLLLGSFWSFIPAILAATLMILRTSLEDKTLHNELPGYPEFAKKTRYRLIPGIW
jgi:protein-S-isoprenylcysteine O-methyltransferase Ste14